jgi:hypothetical protein
VALLAAAALTTAAHASSPRTLTLPYHGPLIGSGSLAEDFAGTAKFQVPSTWKTERSGRYYELTPPAVNGCTIKLQVNNQPTLTKATTAAQVDAALPVGFRAAQLGRGSRTHGSWGADETTNHTTPTRRRVYAIGVIHLTGHLYDHIRAVATYDGTCPDDIVRDGPDTAALERIARTATFTVCTGATRARQYLGSSM